MKPLRLNNEQYKNLFDVFSSKLNDSLRSSKDFEFTKKDMTDFLKKVTPEEIRPTIAISAEAYIKMLELVNQSPVEISWHGLVLRDKNIYYLYEILVFPQINSATSTTTDDNDFATWQGELIANPEFPIQNLRMHGHSHVNMNVYSSDIDDAYQSDILTKVKDNDYYLFLVLNKKMEICALLYDFRNNILFETKDMDIKIVGHHTEDIKEWCSKEIEKKCRTSRVIATARYNSANPYSDLGLDVCDCFDLSAKPVFKGGSRWT